MLVRAATEEARRRLLERGFADVTPLDAVILVQLHGHGASRATQIAERMGISKQAIQRPLRRMHAHGYTETAADPGDRRAHLVCLSEAGRQAAIAVLDVAEEIDHGWEEIVDRERLAAGKALLLALAREVRNARTSSAQQVADESS